MIDHKSPHPQTIRRLRARKELRQADAADLVRVDIRTWQRWEAGDREMMPGLWDLFRIRVGDLTR